MEISILLVVLDPKYQAQILDTMPSFRTLHAQLSDTPYTTENNNILVKHMYILERNTIYINICTTIKNLYKKGIV